MRQLDRDRIVAEALRLLDEHGTAGFSIRRIAQALGVTPMALYHHVRNKAELATLVIDAAACERPLAASTGDWRDDLWAVAWWMRESSRAHPALADLRRTYAVWTPSVLILTNRWVALWRESGLPISHALMAAHASSRAIIGLVATERPANARDMPSHDLLAEMPDAGLLLTPFGNDDRLFEVSVRALIDGLFQYFDTRKDDNVQQTGEALWRSIEEHS